MLTPEPLEMKPHVYCTWRGVGVGAGVASKSNSWSHLSINWTFCSSLSVSFHFIKHHFTEIPGFIVLVFFLLGARVPVGP